MNRLRALSMSRLRALSMNRLRALRTRTNSQTKLRTNSQTKLRTNCSQNKRQRIRMNTQCHVRSSTCLETAVWTVLSHSGLFGMSMATTLHQYSGNTARLSSTRRKGSKPSKGRMRSCTYARAICSQGFLFGRYPMHNTLTHTFYLGLSTISISLKRTTQAVHYLPKSVFRTGLP
jgi:hypothetical protein